MSSFFTSDLKKKKINSTQFHSIYSFFVKNFPLKFHIQNLLGEKKSVMNYTQVKEKNLKTKIINRSRLYFGSQ